MPRCWAAAAWPVMEPSALPSEFAVAVLIEADAVVAGVFVALELNAKGKAVAGVVALGIAEVGGGAVAVWFDDRFVPPPPPPTLAP